ncbi:MAG: flagellar FlbD family protein [Synergistaceae bacterium]|jgi:flagellar protein FlbD|nr:flagellar FlbD family protein [Synergistaceae bacterium]
MIELHRLNGELFLLNSDMIETVDATPDTVVRLVNGHRYVVKEDHGAVRAAVVNFRREAGYACIPFGIHSEGENGRTRSSRVNGNPRGIPSFVRGFVMPHAGCVS